jgi:hypothetical protein
MRDRMRVFGMNMAPRANRRWLVAAIFLIFLVAWAFVWVNPSRSGILLLLMATIVNGVILGGYGRNGLIKPFATRTPFGAPTPWRNDEREIHRRDRMHFYAYRFVVILLILGYCFGVSPFHHPQVGRALLLAGMVLGPTLPQALLLWSEPDMEFAETA